MIDDPLLPLGELIDLAGVRIQRGMTSHAATKCKHMNIRFCEDRGDRRVWCVDCQSNIDPFDALAMIALHLQRMLDSAHSMRAEAQKALGATARLRATKVLDRAWSGNVMAVACPHCKNGLLPEDFLTGSHQISRDLEIARRKRRDSQKV